MLRRISIHETEVGLRYRRGRYERLLEPGGHWLLGTGIRVRRVDSRRRLSVIGSQEVLTSDSVQLRCSAVVAFRVSGGSTSARASRSSWPDVPRRSGSRSSSSASAT